MAHVITTGALPTSTASTANQQPLSGKADYLHFRVDAITYMKLADSTASSDNGTGIGIILTTGETHTFVAGKPGPKYAYWVATGAESFSILETF